MLLVLDNVDAPAQVRPLLPPTARDCRLLLAGTGRLAAVDGVVAYWLAEPDVDDAVEMLDELADGAFVVGAPGDRYEVRPLLAGYARMHLRDTEPVRRRVTVQARLTRHLARRAEQQVAALAAGALDRDQRLPDDDPYGWLDLHQELLLAVVQVPAGAVETLPRRVRNWWFRLAVALCGWLAHTERLDEWEDVCRTVLANPTAQDRPEIAGWAHNELGVLRRRRHDPYGAVAALSLAVAGQGRRGTAQARMNLGLALLDLGREHLELSRRHRSGGRPRRPGAQRSRAGCGEAGAVRAGHRARPAGSGGELVPFARRRPWLRGGVDESGAGPLGDGRAPRRGAGVAGRATRVRVAR